MADHIADWAETYSDTQRRRGKRWLIAGVVGGAALIAATAWTLVRGEIDPMQQLRGPGWTRGRPVIQDEDRAAAMRAFLDGGHLIGRTPEEVVTFFHLTPPAGREPPYDRVYALYPVSMRRGPQATIRLGLKVGDDGRITAAELLFDR